jgi:hypothetical protein
MLDIFLQADGLLLMEILVLLVLIALFFYVKYVFLRLRGLVKSLKLVSAKSSALLPSGQKSLMDLLLTRVRGTGNNILITAWEDYYRDYTTLLHGEIVPDVASYFSEERLITVPCARRMVERLWYYLLYLGIAGALLYLAINLQVYNKALSGAFIGGILGQIALYLAAVLLIIFIFRLADTVAVEETRRSLWNFQYQIAEWLNPLTEATMISVLVESQQKQAKVFREAVNELGKRLDQFETGTLAPLFGRLFQDALEQQLVPVMKESADILADLSAAVVEKQENGMQQLACTFTEQVTSLTADRLSAFAETADKVSQSLTGITEGMEKILTDMEVNRLSQETAAQENRIALAEAGRIQNEVSQALQASLGSIAQASAIAEELRGYAIQGLDKADAMAQQSLQLMESNIAQVVALQNRLGELSKNIDQNIEFAVSRVAGEFDRVMGDFSGLSAELETTRQKQSAELEARLEKLVGGLNENLAGYSERLTAESTAAAAVYHSSLQEILNSSALMMDKFTAESTAAAAVYRSSLQEILDSNTLTAEKLTAATAEVSLAGSRVLEQINLQTGLLYSDLATRVETVYNTLAERVETVYNGLAGQVDTSYSTLAGQVETMQQRIGTLTGTLEQNTDTVISRVAGELDRVLKEYAQLSTKLEAARKVQSAELESRVAVLVSRLDQTLAEHGERLKADSLVAAEEFHNSLEEVLSSNAQTAAQLAEASAEVSLVGGRILEQTNQRATQLYSDLAGRMDKSIDALGENLAAGMQTAMANSIEIVEKLTIETEAMKDMYDSYFTRIGEQSTKTLDEMDFNMEKIFTNFSAQTEQIIGRLTESSGSALDFFDKGIKDLVGFMDEHSRNIGLYAKEINLDVADLATNLRESVQEFSSQIEVGISRTFEDFDKGLGDITLRLANILESIRESVEALQKALVQK